jgi:hypothetical protein
VSVRRRAIEHEIQLEHRRTICCAAFVETNVPVQRRRDSAFRCNQLLGSTDMTVKAVTRLLFAIALFWVSREI